LWYNRDYLRGLSFLNGNVAIIRGDKSFLEETTIHEIGHLFGLDHCSDITCIMALNNDEFDSGHFCNSCRVHYNQKLNNNCITSK
jgi:predicted Zn-dependent protease